MMLAYRSAGVFLGATLALIFSAAGPTVGEELHVAEQIEVDRVWAGHPVRFALLTHGGRQIAAYYDAQRQMTVASRRLGDDRWQRVKLDTAVEWDSHNSITMTLDPKKHLHL